MQAPKLRFKIKPWAHQLEALTLSWAQEYFALFMEQGTGKTKVIIDTAAALFARRKVNTVLVCAPDGVQTGWVQDELHKHMSPDVGFIACVYRNRAGVQARRLQDTVMRGDLNDNRLRVLGMNYDLLATNEGRKAARDFLCRPGHDTLLVGDESHKFKTPKAVRTKAVLDLSAFAKYRRILTGTAALSPLDLWTQCRFLDPDVLGYSSFVAFKAHFCELEPPTSYLQSHINRRLVAKYGEKRANAMMPRLVKKDDEGMPIYKNLDELKRLVDRCSFRVVKSECMDLPPKVYSKRIVQLTPEQRRMYDSLAQDMMVEYEGGLMTATLAMVRYGRLHQITGGFFKADNALNALPIKGGNPKLEALLDAVEDADGKVVIWAAFTQESDAILYHLRERYGAQAVALYRGDNKGSRDKDKWRFTNVPTCRFFVSNQAAGGTGLDGLQVANTVIYYSNSNKLRDRLQSEDRTHRGGSEIHHSVNYIDIVAEDSYDEKQLRALRANKNVADMITGDSPKEWI